MGDAIKDVRQRVRKKTSADTDDRFVRAASERSMLSSNMLPASMLSARRERRRNHTYSDSYMLLSERNNPGLLTTFVQAVRSQHDLLTPSSPHPTREEQPADASPATPIMEAS